MFGAKSVFDNATANDIADPEMYNRSDNGKVDVHIDHTSLPEGPNTSFVTVDATLGGLRSAHMTLS